MQVCVCEWTYNDIVYKYLQVEAADFRRAFALFFGLPYSTPGIQINCI